MQEDQISKLKDHYEKQYSLFASVFNTPNGEKVIAQLERDCYLNRSTISDTNKIDPCQIAFREGMRSVILKIRNLSNESNFKNFLKEYVDANK